MCDKKTLSIELTNLDSLTVNCLQSLRCASFGTAQNGGFHWELSARSKVPPSSSVRDWHL